MSSIDDDFKELGDLINRKIPCYLPDSKGGFKLRKASYKQLKSKNLIEHSYMEFIIKCYLLGLKKKEDSILRKSEENREHNPKEDSILRKSEENREHNPKFTPNIFRKKNKTPKNNSIQSKITSTQVIVLDESDDENHNKQFEKSKLCIQSSIIRKKNCRKICQRLARNTSVITIIDSDEGDSTIADFSSDIQICKTSSDQTIINITNSTVEHQKNMNESLIQVKQEQNIYEFKNKTIDGIDNHKLEKPNSVFNKKFDTNSSIIEIGDSDSSIQNSISKSSRNIIIAFETLETTASEVTSSLNPSQDLLNKIFYVDNQKEGKWIEARLIKIYDGMMEQRIYELKNEVKNITFLLDGRYIADIRPPSEILPLKTKVVACNSTFSGDGRLKKGNLASGIIAEVPNIENDFRYLVFFHSGSVEYFCHDKIYKTLLEDNTPLNSFNQLNQIFLEKYFAGTINSNASLNIGKKCTLLIEGTLGCIPVEAMVLRADCSLVVVNYFVFFSWYVERVHKQSWRFVQS